MKNATQNVTTAINLAAHLNERVEDIRFEVVKSNQNGAVLYAVTCWSGEIRYVIEGETGELKGCYEDRDEALADWNA